MAKDQVKKEDYENHKAACALNFQEMLKQQNALNLAVFGDKETKTMGMLDKVNEMHAIFIGSGFTFKVFLKLLAVVSLIAGVITYTVKLK